MPNMNNKCEESAFVKLVDKQKFCMSTYSLWEQNRPWSCCFSVYLDLSFTLFFQSEPFTVSKLKLLPACPAFAFDEPHEKVEKKQTDK